MKELRDGETTHAIGSVRDRELQHLVTSSIPSPPFSGLSLINTSQGITIYSAHLLASIAASNPGARFQLPIPIPLSVPGQTANNDNNNNNTNNTKGSIQHQQSNQQSRDKVFTCSICNRCFGYKHVLQNHERTHTGEKPYFCKICNKRFTRDHHLKTHMRLHTGEKPYNCTHCDKQFVQVANLRRHLRVHTGERPYSCELCDSKFSDSNQLKAHMLIHKGQKPYYCEVCTMRFRRRHHLTQHKCAKNNEDQAFPHSPPDISPPASNKRERKSRETRRIIRVAGLPVATVTSTGLDSFMPVPEQTHPEDLSVGSGGGRLGRNRSYSGSHSSSSVSASPSPSGGSRGSLGPYCHSVSSNEQDTE